MNTTETKENTPLSLSTLSLAASKNNFLPVNLPFYKIEIEFYRCYLAPNIRLQKFNMAQPLFLQNLENVQPIFFRKSSYL